MGGAEKSGGNTALASEHDDGTVMESHETSSPLRWPFCAPVYALVSSKGVGGEEQC